MAQIVNAMCVEFNYGCDVEQSAEYEALQQQYLWTQCEIAEHNKFDVPEPVTHLRG
jgi:hypothetical protein